MERLLIETTTKTGIIGKKKRSRRSHQFGETSKRSAGKKAGRWVWGGGTEMSYPAEKIKGGTEIRTAAMRHGLARVPFANDASVRRLKKSYGRFNAGG